MPITKFEPQKPKSTYLSITGKANYYIQCQSTPVRINFQLPYEQIFIFHLRINRLRVNSDADETLA